MIILETVACVATEFLHYAERWMWMYCHVFVRVGNLRGTHNTGCDKWPSVMIISQCSDSLIISILQDSSIMRHCDICLTEEYKMQTLKT